MEVSIDTAWDDAQVDQSNAARGRGGGPNTQEGKEVVRWNATRHGISSPKPVVPGLERRPPSFAPRYWQTVSQNERPSSQKSRGGRHHGVDKEE